MNKATIFLALLALTGCRANDSLTAALELSEGHTHCLDIRLTGELDAARIVEVIPSQETCSIEDVHGLLTTGSSACPKQLTTVHFGRVSRPELTDSIPQKGWILPDTPVRIARRADGGYAVFVPTAARQASLAPSACSTFERRVRTELKAHFLYASKKKGSKESSFIQAY